MSFKASNGVLRVGTWEIMVNGASCLGTKLYIATFHGIQRLRHSIMLSALINRLSGTVRPSALAVLRLITSSNFIDA